MCKHNIGKKQKDAEAWLGNETDIIGMGNHFWF